VVHAAQQRHLEQHAEQAGDDEGDRQRHEQRQAGDAEDLVGDVRGVGAGHDELAVRHVDDTHLTERERQTERGQQEDRPHAQPVEHLGDQDSHGSPLWRNGGLGLTKVPTRGNGHGARPGYSPTGRHVEISC
jgi:hypothetical protein